MHAAEDEEAGEAARTRDSGVRLGPTVGTLAAVAAVVVGLSVMPLGKLLVFALLCAALAPLPAVLRFPAWGPLKHVLAGALTVALTAFALTAVHYQGHHATTADASTPPSTPRHEPAPLPRFLPTGPIPHCASFSGTGAIPTGSSLVLFDRPSDSAGHYSPTSTFSYDGQAAPSPAGWTASDLYIGSGDAGDQDGHLTIVAVLLPQSTADFLDSLTASSYTGRLPPSVTSLGMTADRLVVTRNAQNARCRT